MQFIILDKTVYINWKGVMSHWTALSCSNYDLLFVTFYDKTDGKPPSKHINKTFRKEEDVKFPDGEISYQQQFLTLGVSERWFYLSGLFLHFVYNSPEYIIDYLLWSLTLPLLTTRAWGAAASLEVDTALPYRFAKPAGCRYDNAASGHRGFQERLQHLHRRVPTKKQSQPHFGPHSEGRRSLPGGRHSIHFTSVFVSEEIRPHSNVLLKKQTLGKILWKKNSIWCMIRLKKCLEIRCTSFPSVLCGDTGPATTISVMFSNSSNALFIIFFCFTILPATKNVTNLHDMREDKGGCHPELPVWLTSFYCTCDFLFFFMLNPQTIVGKEYPWNYSE